MKILIYSHPPTAMTGFGRVISNLSNFLSKDHDVYILPVTGYCGKPFPYNTGEERYCVILPGVGDVASSWQWCSYWAKELSIDIVIQHFDIWMLPPGWIESVPCPVITYAPVDSAVLQKGFKEACYGAHTNVAMTVHAHRLFQENDMPSTVIPHGVDPYIFTPFSKEAAKRQLGIPEDSFVVGIVATNGSVRKNIGGQIRAYMKFADSTRAKTTLYLHTQVLQTNPESYDVRYMVEGRDDVIWTDPDLYAAGVADHALPVIYNSFDVLLQATFGEGFGLPVIEAQSCGVPVIVNKGTGHEELGQLGGAVLNHSLPIMLPYSSAVMFLPDEAEIVDYLKEFLSKGFRKARREEALTQAKYFQWEVIFPLWKGVLDRLTDTTGHTSKISAPKNSM